ncbi:MAG: hypothetical protein HOB73_14785, partial [Planctomycetaceae bacterium]|nr:hypothetical protein [Planctomycetaceae bacterium]
MSIATDIYSLGAILFEILFNRPPRSMQSQPSSLQSLLNSVIKGNIPRAMDIATRNKRIIASICDKCLATSPNDRYTSVQNLIDDLYRWRDDEQVFAAPNIITQRISRTVRRHQRTTLTTLFLLLLATIVTCGFYSAVTSSQSTLRRARDSERKQQTDIDRQQILLTSAISDAIDARLNAESGKQAAELQTRASTNATLEHQLARQLSVDATERANIEQRKADNATKEADIQSKRANTNRAELDRVRLQTEHLSYKRQLDIEAGYTKTAMQLADSGDFQTALAWASVSHDHAESIDRNQIILAEHQTRIMAIRNRLPGLIGYRQLSDTPLLTRYSPTANALAVVTVNDESRPATVQLFHGNTLQQLHPPFPIELSASVITFSTDGLYLIVAGKSNQTPRVNEIVLISLTDLSLQRYTPSVPGHITTLAATTDRVVLGTDKGLLNTYNIPNIALRHSVTAHRGVITTMLLSPDGSMVATGSTDSTARLWELDTLTPLSIEMQHKSAVVNVRFSNVANAVITTSANGFSLSWDSTQFLTKPRLARGPTPAAPQSVTATAHHPTELLFAIGTDDGSVRVFNSPGSDFIAPLSFISAITTLAFSEDARLLTIGTTSGQLSIYDFSQRQMIYEKVSHLGSISSVNLSSNNRFATVTTGNGHIILWDLAQANLAPVQYAAGEDVSILCPTASQSAVLFVTNKSTLNEVTSDSHFSQLGVPIEMGMPIDQIALSPYSTKGFVISQRFAQLITTSPLNPVGPRIEFAGNILDVTISVAGRYALSSADRSIVVGHFDEQGSQTRITSHKLAAKFIRFNSDISALVVVGAIGDATSSRVIQTVSITDDSVSKRVIAPFDINSVGTALLPNSNDLVVTSTEGKVWRLDTDSLRLTPFHDLVLDARRITRHGKLDFLLARDDTIVGLSCPEPLPTYHSNFQTNHTSHSARLNWILRANDSQFSIQSAQTGNHICPPVSVPAPILDALLLGDRRRPRVLIATTDGVYDYSIETTGDPNHVFSVNHTLLSGSRLDSEQKIVPLSNNDVTKLLLRVKFPLTDKTGILPWLRRYSTNISADQWRSHIAGLRTKLSKMSANQHPSSRKALVEDLNYALLSSGSYLEAINLFLSADDNDVKPSYQAVVLSAWLDDEALYNRALRRLLRTADPRIPQHFVYLLNGISLAAHNLPTESLLNALDRLPDRLAGNVLVQRGQLGLAIFRDDRLLAADVLAKMTNSELSLPLRLYSKMAGHWINPQSLAVESLGQLRHQISVLPSLQGGNPGRNWEERCLLDILMRRLQQTNSANLKGDDND